MYAYIYLSIYLIIYISFLSIYLDDSNNNRYNSSINVDRKNEWQYQALRTKLYEYDDNNNNSSSSSSYSGPPGLILNHPNVINYKPRMIDITDKNKDVDGMMKNQKVAMDDVDVIDSTSVNACNHDNSNDGDSSSYKLPPVYEDWYDIDINMINDDSNNNNNNNNNFNNNNNNSSCNNKTYNSDDEKEWVDYLAAKRANMKDKSQSYIAYVPKRTNQELVSSSLSSKAVKGGNIDENEISCTKETLNDNVKVRNEDDYDNDNSSVIHATAVTSSAMYIDDDDNDDRDGSYNENSTATIFKNDYFETEYEFEQYLQLLQLEEERHSKRQQQHHQQQQQQQQHSSSQEQYHRDTNVAVAIAYCQPSSLSASSSSSSYSSASTVAAVIAIPIASEEDEGRFQDNYHHHHHGGSNGRQRKDGKINRQVVNKFDALAFDDSDGDDDDDNT